jgi:hypothetical protein
MVSIGEGALVVAGDFTALGTGPWWPFGAGTSSGRQLQPRALAKSILNLNGSPQVQTGIDGRDLGAIFRSSGGGAHSSWADREPLFEPKKPRPGELGLSLYSQFPGYEEIGSSNRADAHGVGFTARLLNVPWFFPYPLRGPGQMLPTLQQILLCA